MKKIFTIAIAFFAVLNGLNAQIENRNSTFSDEIIIRSSEDSEEDTPPLGMGGLDDGLVFQNGDKPTMSRIKSNSFVFETESSTYELKVPNLPLDHNEVLNFPLSGGTVARIEDLPVSGNLIAVNEGNGEGYRNGSLQSSSKGVIGNRAYDFGYSTGSKQNTGAIGFASVDFGEDNILLGYGAVAYGDNNTGNSTYSFITGSNNNDINNGGWNFTHGYFNTHTGGTHTQGAFVTGMRNVNAAAHNFTMGNGNENNTVAGLTAGVALLSPNNHGATTLGVANALPSDYEEGHNKTNGISLLVGNGLMDASTGSSGKWTASNRSNNLELYNSGKFLLPSTDLETIESDTTGKHVITKEYLLSKISASYTTDWQNLIFAAGVTNDSSVKYRILNGTFIFKGEVTTNEEAGFILGSVPVEFAPDENRIFLTTKLQEVTFSDSGDIFINLSSNSTYNFDIEFTQKINI